MTVGYWRASIITVGIYLIGLVGLSGASMQPSPPSVKNGPPSAPPTEHVILFVLEGFGQDSLKGGTMPTMSKLIKDGSVTWSATGVKPALRLPTMASIITGVPVEKHGINWNSFEFSRGYPRAPSVFDSPESESAERAPVTAMTLALSGCGVVRPAARVSDDGSVPRLREVVVQVLGLESAPFAPGEPTEARRRRPRLVQIPRCERVDERQATLSLLVEREMVDRDEIGRSRRALGPGKVERDELRQPIGNRHSIRHRRNLHEVEVPEQADPHDAGQDVQPAEEERPPPIVEPDPCAGAQAGDDDEDDSRKRKHSWHVASTGRQARRRRAAWRPT